MISVRNNLVNGFSNVVDSLLSIPELIGEKIRELFEEFFLPDEELMNERLETLRSEFAFVDSIAGFGDNLLETLQSSAGSSPPVITVNLGKSTAKYVITIDFSWYAQFKPMVDNIVAGIIWLTFMWHMYKKIPDIIHGNSMSTAAVNQIIKK